MTKKLFLNKKTIPKFIISDIHKSFFPPLEKSAKQLMAVSLFKPDLLCGVLLVEF